MQKEGVKFREAVSIAQRVLESSGQVLRQRDSRGGGLPRRARNNFGRSTEGGLGRRTRPNVGA
jgi:hypothetical protein